MCLHTEQTASLPCVWESVGRGGVAGDTFPGWQPRRAPSLTLTHGRPLDSRAFSTRFLSSLLLAKDLTMLQHREEMIVSLVSGVTWGVLNGNAKQELVPSLTRYRPTRQTSTVSYYRAAKFSTESPVVMPSRQLQTRYRTCQASGNWEGGIDISVGIRFTTKKQCTPRCIALHIFPCQIEIHNAW